MLLAIAEQLKDGTGGRRGKKGAVSKQDSDEPGVKESPAAIGGENAVQRSEVRVQLLWHCAIGEEARNIEARFGECPLPIEKHARAA